MYFGWEINTQTPAVTLKIQLDFNLKDIKCLWTDDEIEKSWKY